MDKSKYAGKSVKDSIPFESDRPANGVLALDFHQLRANGIKVEVDVGKGLLLWSDPAFETNEEFSELTVQLVESAGYDGVESHMMYDAINRAELNIRLIGVLQGKGIKQ